MNKKEKKYCKLHSFIGSEQESKDCSDCKSPKPEKKVRIEEIKGSVVIEPTAMNECPYINYGVLAEMKIKINKIIKVLNSR